jgi:hypothetical protein
MSHNVYFTDQGLGLIFKRTVGSAASKDIGKELVNFLHENKVALPAIRYLYIDYSEADRLKVSQEDILQFVEIAKIIAQENSQLVVAICAPQFDNYCITRMWEVNLPDHFGWTTTAFRDREKAQAWLQKTVQASLTFV